MTLATFLLLFLLLLQGSFPCSSTHAAAYPLPRYPLSSRPPALFADTWTAGLSNSRYRCILLSPPLCVYFCTKLPKGQGFWVVCPGCLFLWLASCPCRRPASAASLVDDYKKFYSRPSTRCRLQKVVKPHQLSLFAFLFSYNSRRFLSFDLHLMGLGLFLSFGLNFSCLLQLGSVV